MVRTRVVAGDATLKASLERMRCEVLALPRAQKDLASAVCGMRQKMRAEHNTMVRNRAHFDLKRDPGGIVDIEFVVQYLVLKHAAEHAELTRWSDVIRLLEGLEDAGLVATEEPRYCRRPICLIVARSTRSRLQGRAAEIGAEGYGALREQVKGITDTLLPGLQSG